MAKFKIKSGTYTGTGSGFSVTGLGFTPNFGFIKATDSTSDGGQIKWTGGLSSNQSFDPTSSSSPVTDGITSFDADGFTIGTNSKINTSSSTYTWVMMDIPSANMEGGTYTGNGTSSNPVTALGNGDLLIIKRAGSSQGGWIFGSNSPNRATWTTNNHSSAVSITATGFTVNTTSSVVNSNGTTYFYFILKVNSAWGVQSSYVGDASDGRSLSLSITPEFIWIKGRATNSAPIFRSLGGNSGLYSTQWVANTADSSNDVEGFISLGVTLGSSGSVNANSKYYDYLALKNEVTVTPTSTTKSIQYTIKGAVSTTKSIAYKVKTTPSATTKSLAYKVKTTPSAITKSIAYKVKSSTSVTKGIIYDVIPALSTHSVTKGLIYAVKRSNSTTKSLQYATKRSNSLTKSLAYSVKRSNSTTKSIQYTIKGQVSTTKSIAYKIKGSISNTKQITYKIKASLSQSKSLGYAVKQSNQVNLGITYNIHGGTALNLITKPLAYAVKTSASTQATIGYSVKSSTVVSKGITYNVVRVVTKPLSYAVKAPKTIGKSMQYVVRIYPYSSKSTPFTKKPIPYTEKTNVYRKDKRI